MSSRAYRVVEWFEEALTEYTGAPYAVAVESCTAALFLSCLWHKVKEVTIPAKTYISVPQAIMHAGGSVLFHDEPWTGTYQLKPYPIWDAAKRFRRLMFRDMTVQIAPFVYEPPDDTCMALSFHARKVLNIGRGGAILTNSAELADWARKMRYDGREGLPYPLEVVSLCGYNLYMTPEQAARGLTLLDILPDDNPDLCENYPDLRDNPLFRVARPASRPDDGIANWNMPINGTGPNPPFQPFPAQFSQDTGHDWMPSCGSPEVIGNYVCLDCGCGSATEAENAPCPGAAQPPSIAENI